MSSIVNFGPSSMASDSTIPSLSNISVLDSLSFKLLFSNNCLKASAYWSSFNLPTWPRFRSVSRSISEIRLRFLLYYSSKSFNFLMKMPRISLFSVSSISSRSWFLNVASILLSLVYTPSLIKGFSWSISLSVSILR